jgi:ATP-binding cassette subfamily B protein
MSRALVCRYPLFKLLSPGQIDAWLAQAQEVAFATGELIFQEGTPGAWTYLVLDGRVRIVRQSGQREVSLGVLQSGDLFGEYALLPPGLNTATCRSAAPSRLLRLPLAPAREAAQEMGPVWTNLKNWLRLHTLLHFSRGRAFLGFMSAGSGLKLHDRLRPASFPAGQTIQAGALSADRWFVIEEGRVGLPGGELGPGETFGERALAGWGGVPAAVALTAVRCQVLSRQDFDPRAPAPGLPASLVLQSYEARGPARPATHVWVPQLGPADCGLAALAMVGGRLGAKVGVEELRARLAPGPRGLSLQQLERLAAALGWGPQAVWVSADRLGQVCPPAIAHLEGGHYVVVHELGPAGVVVGDPAAGVVTWGLEFFARCYSGSMLLFDPPRP